MTQAVRHIIVMVWGTVAKKFEHTDLRKQARVAPMLSLNSSTSLSFIWHPQAIEGVVASVRPVEIAHELRMTLGRSR